VSLSPSWEVTLLMLGCMPVYAGIQFCGKKILDKLVLEHDKKTVLAVQKPKKF
jgi:hypothetical protein